MPSEVVYLPLRGASRDARTTKANMQWPAMVALDNFHSSTSTETPTAREAITGKAVLPHITLASGAKNWLNTIVPQANLYTESFLSRLHPGAYADSVADSLQCTAHTYVVSISSASTTVTRESGSDFLGAVYPGDFFKFAGDDTYYDVVSITNNDVLELSAAPGAKSSETCTLYTTHCPYRAQWPLYYTKYGDIHIYHAVDPTGASPQSYMRPPFRKAANNDVDIITTTTGTPTSYNYYPITATTTTPQLGKIVNGATSGDIYGIGSIISTGYVSTLWYSENSGVSWARSYLSVGYVNDPNYLGLWYDSSNSRLLYSSKASYGMPGGGGWTYEVGFAKSTTDDDKFPLHAFCLVGVNGPKLHRCFGDGTNYVLVGSQYSGGSTKSCVYYRAIAGLVSNETARSTDNRGTVVQITGSGLIDGLYNGSTLYVAVGESGSVVTSADLTTWTERNGGNQTYRLVSVANNSTTDYVAVGTSGTIVESADATTWNGAVSGVTTDLNAVCYGNSLFVAVGDAGVILTSPDRTSWTSRTSTTSANLSSVLWDGTTFVASSDNTSIVLLSADGVTWADTSSKSPGPVTSVVQGSVSGSIDCIASTRDGGGTAYPNGVHTWSASAWPSIATQDDCNDIAYANSLYVAVGDAGKIATSTDGVTWTRQTSGVASDLFGVCYDATNAKWIAVGAMALLTSADAITWSDDSASIPATLTDTEFRRVRYITDTTTVLAVGYDATANRPVTMYSTDAAAWTHALITNQDSEEFWDVTYNAATSEYLWCGSRPTAPPAPGVTGAVWRNATLEYTNEDIIHPTSWDADANFQTTDITGMTFANSTWGRLYARWTDSTTTLDWYSDSARTALVASGVGAPGTTITMVEQSGSGLSGSVDVLEDQSGDLDFTVRVEYAGVELVSETCTCIRSVWCDTNRIVWAGIGSDASGYCGVDYSGVNVFNTSKSFYSVTMARTPEQYAAGELTNSYWLGYDLGLGLINIGNQVTTTESVYWYPLSVYACNALINLDGYVVELGTRELSSGAWTYYPRRARWTSPGTYSDFSGFGSGAQDFPGFGDFLAGEVVEHTGVIFEKGGIGALNWTGETDPTAGPIWTYRQIARGLTTISNPVVHEGAIWFVGNTGLLYRTNGIEAVPTGGEFDLSKFTEFPPTTPVQMVFVPATRQLAVLVQSSGEVTSPSVTYVDNKVYMVNIDSGKTTTWTVSAPGQRLSLVQVIGADSPTWPA